MRVLLCDPPPLEFEQLLDERRRTGTDRFDEVWDGVLHMAPVSRGRHGRLAHQISVLLDAPACAAGLFICVGGFNLGVAGDYRIPDSGAVRESDDLLYYPSAALAIEILSPGDETWDKLGFYAAHGVDELLVIDPVERSVQWFALRDGAYAAIERSGLMASGPAELADGIHWPPVVED
jgi:Uma2 family endonuclease